MKTGFRYAAGFGTVLALATSLQGAISLTVATNKTQYVPGEALYIDVTVHNSGSEEVTLVFPSSLVAYYSINGRQWRPIAADVIMDVTLPGNGTLQRTYRHRWSGFAGYNPGLGTHSVRGHLNTIKDPMSTPPIQIEVISANPPAQDFLVDFDTMPVPVQALEEYWAWGVHFRGSNSSTTWDGPRFRVGASCHLVGSPSGTNIIADFDIPILAASVDVSSKKGSAVTLIARDTEGRSLATLTSPVISADNVFVPLRIQSDTPIASLEWWPSDPNYSVSIDNLFLSHSGSFTALPEPSSLLLFAAGLSLLVGRRRR